MEFTQAIESGIRKMFTFKGRASRSEYWWFVLFYFLMMLAIGVSSALIASIPFLAPIAALLVVIVYIAAIIAFISLGVRRLHDTNRTGAWYLIVFIPAGSIVLFVFFVLRGTLGANTYGADPLGDDPHGFEDEADTESYSKSTIPVVRRD